MTAKKDPVQETKSSPTLAELLGLLLEDKGSDQRKEEHARSRHCRQFVRF